MRSWISTGIALTVGLGVGLALDGADSSRAATAPHEARDAGLESRLERLEARLSEERAERERLARDLIALEGRFAALDAAPRSDVSIGPGREDTRRAESSRLERAPSRPVDRDVERLVEAGFPARDVEAWSARLDEIEMKQLYLRDRATREGWLDSPRFAEESGALFGEVMGTRDEFGDALFDWTLYTKGYPNRVRVSDVMEGSPAAEVGIEPGDTIRRYADQAVLGAAELQELTRSGRVEETTPVEVVRDGETIRLLVPRGPLGVRIEPVSEEPETPR